jgi:hypothetical protein
MDGVDLTIEMTNPAKCRAPSRFLGVDGSTERDVAIAGFASGTFVT